MEPGLIVLVVLVVLLASTAQTASGFGFALIAVPLLVTVLSVRDAVAITSLLALLSSLLLARITWADAPRRMILTMLAASFAGMPVGLAVLLLAPGDVLRVIVGAASIAMALLLATDRSLGGGGARSEALAGAISGVLNTSTGMNGPPVVLYLQHRRLPPLRFRAGLSMFFSVSGVVSLTLLASFGVVGLRALSLSAWALPSVLLGHVIGHRIAGYAGDETFRRMVLALLCGTAGVAVATGVARLVG